MGQYCNCFAVANSFRALREHPYLVSFLLTHGRIEKTATTMPIYSVKSMNPYYSLSERVDNARGLSTANVVDHSSNSARRGMFMDFSRIPDSSPLNVVDSTMGARKGMFLDYAQSEIRPSHVSVSPIVGAGKHTPHYSLNILG